jgi:hypothetical protein
VTPPAPIPIDAFVDEAERGAVVAAAEQLCECLGAATGQTWSVRLAFRPAGGALTATEPGGLVVASLLPDVARASEPMAAVEARWRAQLSSLPQAAAPPFICTVFRRVSDDPTGQVLERIRRLNLLAAELSHDTGALVIDIDRVFAHIGARTLKTDYRMAGALAAEAAAHTIVGALLAAGLDDIVSPEVQDKAKAHHGGLMQIGAVVQRRLARKRS